MLLISLYLWCIFIPWSRNLSTNSKTLRVVPLQIIKAKWLSFITWNFTRKMKIIRKDWLFYYQYSVDYNIIFNPFTDATPEIPDIKCQLSKFKKKLSSEMVENCFLKVMTPKMWNVMENWCNYTKLRVWV